MVDEIEEIKPAAKYVEARAVLQHSKTKEILISQEVYKLYSNRPWAAIRSETEFKFRDSKYEILNITYKDITEEEYKRNLYIY